MRKSLAQILCTLLDLKAAIRHRTSRVTFKSSSLDLSMLVRLGCRVGLMIFTWSRTRRRLAGLPCPRLLNLIDSSRLSA